MVRCNNVALFSVEKENDDTWNAFLILMDIWCMCRFDGIVIRVLLMWDVFTSFYLYNEESVGLQLWRLKSSKLGV